MNSCPAATRYTLIGMGFLEFLAIVVILIAGRTIQEVVPSFGDEKSQPAVCKRRFSKLKLDVRPDFLTHPLGNMDYLRSTTLIHKTPHLMIGLTMMMC